MQHPDPKLASDDAFDDEPTGTWRVIGKAQLPPRKDEIDESDLETDLASGS